MSLDAVGLICADLKETVRFYAYLGLDLVEAGGPEHLEGSTSDGFRIMADSEDLMKKIHPGKDVRPGGGGVVLCFRQKDSDGVDACYQRIVVPGLKASKSPGMLFGDNDMPVLPIQMVIRSTFMRHSDLGYPSGSCIRKLWKSL